MAFEFFYSPLFKYFLFPLLCLLGTVILKCTTRRDEYEMFKREDMVVGVDLIWGSITIYIAGIADKASQYVEVQRIISERGAQTRSDVALTQRSDALIQQLSTSGFIIFALLLLAVGTALIVRAFGWRSPDDPKGTVAIGMPLALGLSSLGIVMWLLSETSA